MGGTAAAGQNVDIELGNSTSTQLSFISTATRSLTGVATGPVILPDSFWGKGLSAPTSFSGTTREMPKVKCQLTSIAYGNGVFVAIGSKIYFSDTENSVSFHSTDGITWSQPIQIPYTSRYNYLTKIVFGAGVFVAIGGTYGYTSTDGITWSSPIRLLYQTGSTVYSNSAAQVIGFAHGYFSVLGLFSGSGYPGPILASNIIITTSTNGTVWSELAVHGDHTALTDYNLLMSIAFSTATNAGYHWIAVGQNTNNNKKIATYLGSNSGGTAALLNGTDTTGANSIVYGGGKFVILSWNDTKQQFIIVNIDEQGTQSQTTILSGTNYASNALNAIAYNNGQYLAVGSKYATSTDGTTWTVHSINNTITPTPAQTVLTAVAYGNGKFVAVGWERDSAGNYYPVCAI